MPFTDEERRQWLEEKRHRERKDAPVFYREPPVATCVHCQRPFGFSEGVVTPEVAICDICNGD